MKKKISHILADLRFEYFMLSIIMIGALVVRLYKINNPLADWHAWRQVDTASVTRTFLERGVDLLRPRYHDISSIQTGFFNPEGYRFVEFPFYNLIHLGIYKLNLFSFETAGRLVSVIAAVVATLVLYLMGKRLFGCWVGLAAGFFYAFLPFNVYFTRVVLPDGLSVCIALLGLYLFLEYFYREKNWLVFASAGLFSISILIKPFSVFYGLPVLYLVVRKYGLVGIFKKIPILLALNMTLIPFFLWRGWMNNNPEHLKGVAHLAWAFNGDGIRFRPAFWRWIFGERLGRLILGFWGLVPFCFGLLASDKHKREEKGFLFSFLSGMLMYVVVIATANVRHDYYQVFVIPAIALTLAYGGVWMWKEVVFNKLISRGLLVFSVGMMMGMSLYDIKGFYAINHPEVVVAGEVADRLLPKDAWVIAPYNGDTTFLYQTKRWGWPVVNESIDGMIEKGADYYISVNMDNDTNTFFTMFEAVERNDEFVILDLHKRL